ncbi:MAG: glycosyltransferase family 4 protein [Aureispira sp.]
MRIAVNTRFLMEGKLEGLGWFTHETMKRWVEWHPEHEFIFIFDRPFSEQFIFGDNVTGVVAFPPARHPLLFYCWYEWSIPRILRQHKADVFVSPDGFLSLRTPVPTLMVLHDIAWKHFKGHVNFSTFQYYNHYVPKFVANAGRIATVSNYSKQDMVESFEGDPNKIDVVYNGSHERYKVLSSAAIEQVRAEYSDGQPYFLYVGSIHPRKNVERLLQAFNQFKKATASPLKMLIVGRRMGKGSPIEQLLPTLEHAGDIVFLGYLATDELPSVVGAAYALTYVSLFEGFGIPLLEALYCDVPSITSKTSSMPEVVGDAGLLVDPTSIDSIAEHMQKLWSQADLRQVLIEKGRVQRQLFSWDQTAQKLWKSLEILLQSVD